MLRGIYKRGREEKVAGVDTFNFVQWARRFVEDINNLTAEGRKVLLTYDGYRSHMSMAVLSVLRQGGVIAYCLPAHTSGTTQPLDLTVFSCLKHYYGEGLRKMAAASFNKTYDMFDFCDLITYVYRKAVEPAARRAGFSRAGLCPLDPSQLLGTPRPMSSDAVHYIVSVKNMMALLDIKRAELGENIEFQPVVVRRGFLDTSKGLCLTSEEALKIIQAKEASDREAKAAKENKEKEIAAKRAARETKNREREAAIEAEYALRNARLDALRAIGRPMKVRRAIARARKKASNRLVVANVLAELQQSKD